PSLPPPTSPLFPCTTLFRSLYGPHSLEREHNPAFGVRLEALRRRVLRRGDEDIGQLSALRVHNEVLDRSQDLTVVRHDGLASELDRKSTRLNSSHQIISYAV